MTLKCGHLTIVTSCTYSRCFKGKILVAYLNHNVSMVVALVFLKLLFVSCGLNQMSSHIDVIENRGFGYGK